MKDYTTRVYKPDMTPSEFDRILRTFAAPAVLAERPTREYYEAICRPNARGEIIRHSFILAMFRHESGGGREGVAVETRSWGNTRNPSFGVPHLRIQEDGFSSYPSWLHGCISTVARLQEHVYRDRHWVDEIFIMADDPATPEREHELVWAPSFDRNNPEGYLGAVLRDMQAMGANETQWRDMPEPVIYILPEGANNRPRLVLDYQYVTLHETDNTDPSADAQAHAGYLRGGAVAIPASWHHTVDSHSIITNLFDDEVAWHAADGHNGPGNRTSLAIETCVNEAGTPSLWQATKANAAWLVARKLEAKGLGIERLVQHHHWKSPTYPSGKNCPGLLRARNQWPAFTQMVQAALRKAQPTGPGVQVHFPETGKWLHPEFAEWYWRNGGIRAFGLPITGGFIEDERITQYTEAAILRHFPEHLGDDRVQRDLLAVPILRTRYPEGAPA